MEFAAIYLAIARRSLGWDGLKWLCYLNEVDKDEMRAALKDLSQTIRMRSSEPGIHCDLPR